jgi:hypothetical protein
MVEDEFIPVKFIPVRVFSFFSFRTVLTSLGTTITTTLYCSHETHDPFKTGKYFHVNIGLILQKGYTILRPRLHQ